MKHDEQMPDLEHHQRLQGCGRRRTRTSKTLRASRRRAGQRGRTAAITAINTATPKKTAAAVVGVRSPLILHLLLE
jgi:hypothetical protein